MKSLLIIGAGPYGLSIGAHAKHAGIDYTIVGKPLEFWEDKMPPDMFIRTRLAFTNLSDPERKYTLQQYGREGNLELTYPLKRTTFVDYGHWFIEKVGIEINTDLVTSITKNLDGFIAVTESRREIMARNVVVAVGITNCHYLPETLNSLPSRLVSHSSFHTDYKKFSGKKVLVVGGGQSAWEAAALLYREGANVTLCYRRAGRLPSPPAIGHKILSDLAATFYGLDDAEKQKYRRLFENPTVSDFLVPLVEGNVIQKPNCSIERVEELQNNSMHVYLSSGEVIEVKHIIAATGYQFSINRLPFLNNLETTIKQTETGAPRVDVNFQSSIDGLYFVGPSIADEHGPSFRLISGIDYASKKLSSLFNPRN